MSLSRFQSVLMAGALLAATTFGAPAEARPLYFNAFATLYGFQSGDDLYACGVCHKKWEGTGVRNVFGTQVEQQLYIGKTVPDALLFIEAMDADGDTFSNVDELTVHGTLPGYSCANYEEAQDTPGNFQSLITPGVPTCLEPLDIAVTPTQFTLGIEVGTVANATVTIRNNGSEDPLNLSDVSILPGADPSLTLAPIATPLQLPLGASIDAVVTFAPPSSIFSNATLRVSSDDPDEADIDVSIIAFSFVRNVASPDRREACLSDVDRFARLYAKKSAKEWGRCYLDELRGVACDIGRRDFKIAQAEGKLRDRVGGAKDTRCAGDNLVPNLLGMGTHCAAPCDNIELLTMDDLASCVVCTQDAGLDDILAASIGTTPPDLPSNLLSSDAHRCNRKLQRLTEKGIRKMSKELARCELDNVTAVTPADCSVAAAAVVAKEVGKIDGGLARCSDTTGMAGCLFDPVPDPACLSAVAEDVSLDLIESIFHND